MRDVARPIQEGASGFFKVQYSTIASIALLCIAALAAISDRIKSLVLLLLLLLLVPQVAAHRHAQLYLARSSDALPRQVAT
jgi:Na+/H+-translocating membrane pyrophosphatase